tara:strand:+ start:6928 stop:7554 length:627 start_codon:yes stop_codon:yes gene_type:complete
MKNIEFKSSETNLSFIEGWLMNDTGLCDDLIDFFETNKDKHKEGETFSGVDKNIKDSIDFPIMPKDINDNSYLPIKKYLEHLDACYKKYLLKYEINKHFKEMHIGPFNLQRYKQDGHFNGLHSERMHISSSSRLFAWMTYLNDVNDGGETDFHFYKIKVKPKKGLTLIWPSEWTHMHRGSITNEIKYIITGWIHFPDNLGKRKNILES